MTITRHEYRLELDAMPQAPLPLAAAAVRIPSTEDADALAELMLDAYRGTIDYDDETLEDARSEVARYLAGSPVLECSSVWVADDDRLASALLVSLWPSRSCPIVSYVMTAADQKKRGLASLLLVRLLATLAANGHGEVRAVITEGNAPSETLFARAGFRRV